MDELKTEPTSREEYDTASEIVYNLDMNQPIARFKEYGERMKSFENLVGSTQNKNASTSTGATSTDTLSSFKSKLEKVESGGDYNAYNKGSGAYGKYQFIPSTLKEYAKKTGQTIEQAKTPEGQDKMFERFTDDNKNRLKKMGIEPTELNLWIAHNQGVGGAAAILKRGKLTPRLKKNIASNLPSGVEPTIENYINHWATKFNG